MTISWPPKTKADKLAGLLRKQLHDEGYDLSAEFHNTITIDSPKFREMLDGKQAPHSVILEFFVNQTNKVGIQLATRVPHYYPDGKTIHYHEVRNTGLWLGKLRPYRVGSSEGFGAAMVDYRGKDLEEVAQTIMVRIITCGAAWIEADLGAGPLCNDCPHQLMCLGNGV